ncbi:putative nuclease HARBI1 [Malaya genurostris]|uniref:putative nuclease HARBI1 n=1 Tax=Malaya genurostris TaxID=325434 RepID=UPI0026F3AA2D|nr:putative nuclease HARBI1 [Malaya genurostris]
MDLENSISILLESFSSDETSSSSFASTSSEDFISEVDEWFEEHLVKNKRRKVEDFVHDVVHNYSDLAFKSHFRLTRAAVYGMIEEFASSRFFKTKKFGGRHVVPAETQILSFLWFAANKDSYREVGNLFNIAQSTIYRTFGYIMEFVFDIAPRYIKFPNTDVEKLQAAESFRQIAQFPNVLGCVDGCYIPIRKPARKMAHTYVNRHDQLSITLQGICDAKKKFIDVDVGCSSRMHDARIFENSFISEKLPQICGQQFHILGDAAYPLREYLLVPFKDYGNLSAVQKNYNLKFTQTRVTVENSFGLLKTRFRQLMRLDFHSVERMALFVLACCVLHNMCTDENIVPDAENLLQENIRNDSQPVIMERSRRMDIRSAALRRLGEIKRIEIANTF